MSSSKFDNDDPFSEWKLPKQSAEYVFDNDDHEQAVNFFINVFKGIDQKKSFNEMTGTCKKQVYSMAVLDTCFLQKLSDIGIIDKSTRYSDEMTLWDAYVKQYVVSLLYDCDFGDFQKTKKKFEELGFDTTIKKEYETCIKSHELKKK